MTKVTRDQFRIEDDTCVIHVPTGTKISTYKYKNPGEIGDLTVRHMHDNDHADEYEPHEVRLAALDILKELALDRNEEG